ncbi:MAG TPA: GntR family transcriptional regulator [Cyanobacteria bacterium UBA11049]|nr:GntR family transcriptional regulator [Cyanobacteria bacterium UBA11049]
MSESDSLPIEVDDQAPIAVAVQVAEQIKLLISTGKLKPRDTLPTVIQLAESLKLSHNTIAAVYSDLIEAGYLVAQRGKGTFVAQSKVVQKLLERQHFYQLLDRAFAVGLQLGLSPAEFGTSAYARATFLSQCRVSPLLLVFVGRRARDLNSYLQTIESEIDRPLVFLHLEDLRANEPVALSKLFAADLAITCPECLQQVTQIAAPKREVIAVDSEPDFQVLTQISALPCNAQVLLVCKQIAEAESMKQLLQRTGICHINFQLVDIECIQHNRQLLETSDIVYAHCSVYNFVRAISSQPEKVMSIKFRISQASAAVLKTRLIAIQLGKQNNK